MNNTTYSDGRILIDGEPIEKLADKYNLSGIVLKSLEPFNIKYRPVIEKMLLLFADHGECPLSTQAAISCANTRTHPINAVIAWLSVLSGESHAGAILRRYDGTDPNAGLGHPIHKRNEDPRVVYLWKMLEQAELHNGFHLHALQLDSRNHQKKINLAGMIGAICADARIQREKVMLIPIISRLPYIFEHFAYNYMLKPKTIT